MMEYRQVIFGRYEVIDLYPDGGQAAIAKARDRDGSVVAVRQLLAKPHEDNFRQEQARFKRASELRINHPNVLNAIAFDNENGEWFAIYPFVEGCSLEILVSRSGGRLNPDRAARIARDVASGLRACHAQGVVHRDIKPGNLLIDKNGHVFIIDFGLCTIHGQRTVTEGQHFQGSLPWAAPEQIQSPYCQDPRMDLFSLGEVFYVMLTGRYPAEGQTADEQERSIVHWTPPPPITLDASISHHLSRACMKLLEKQPDRRFQRAEDFIAALEGDGACAGGSGFCVACGREHSADAKFCNACGAPRSSECASRCGACGVEVEDSAGACLHGHIFSAAGHRLQFVLGPARGTVIWFPEGIHEVGREVLCPRDAGISRRQFRAACLNGSVFLADAGSANGTFVNGRPAQPAVLLQPGAEVRIAGNTAIYSCLSKGSKP